MAEKSGSIVLVVDDSIFVRSDIFEDVLWSDDPPTRRLDPPTSTGEPVEVADGCSGPLPTIGGAAALHRPRPQHADRPDPDAGAWTRA